MTPPPWVRRARIWAPVAKAAALFVLPLPLLLAVVAALVAGSTERLLLAAGALASVWGAGVLAWRGLLAEAQYRLGVRADLPDLPLKLTSQALTTFGAGLAAAAGGHTLTGALAFAALAAIGHLAFFGRDLRQPRVTLAPVAGVDVGTVAQQIEEAYQRLRRIEAAARNVAVPEFGERLARIIAIGRGILAEIERDPRQASRARRFLHLYLDSTERVTEEYARTHQRAVSPSLEQNFRRLLAEMEQTFAGQQQKLLENKVLALDVEIEVLNARLKREGMGDYLETRS